MHAFALPPRTILGFGHVSTCGTPRCGEFVGVIDVEVEDPATRWRRVGSVEMEVDALPLREGIALVVVGDFEAETRVVVNRTRHIRDREDRLDRNDPRHAGAPCSRFH